MPEREVVSSKIGHMEPGKPENKIEMTIEGSAEIPFFNDDLHIRAAIALINQSDVKHFENHEELFEELSAELQNVVEYFVG